MKDILTGALENFEEYFSELSGGSTISLQETNRKYTALYQKSVELQDRFPCIEAVLENEGAVSMTAEEHGGFLEYLNVVREMESIECLGLYYSGHRDCIAYLKKTGVL